MTDGIAIAKALDHVESLRILPIVGSGSLQSLNDLLFLKGVDVAIVSSDCLGYARKHSLYKDEAGKVAYIAKLANSSIIVLARPEIKALTDLAGRKVATGTAESDSFVAADLLFGDATTEVERVALSGSDAITALRQGKIDAAILTTGESNALLKSIEPGSGLRILPIMASERLADVYAPAIIDAAQFPNLMPADTAVETVAAALVLAVFDWPKRSPNTDRLQKFSKALYDQYFTGLSPDKLTNFSAAVPGWKAFGEAKQSRSVEPASRAGVLVAVSN